MTRLRRLGAALEPPAGWLTPAALAALGRFVDAGVAAGGGQRPDEPRAAALARGLGLSGPAELRRRLEQRVRCAARGVRGPVPNGRAAAGSAGPEPRPPRAPGAPGPGRGATG